MDRNEEFVRGRGYKLSDISKGQNKFTQPCFECDRRVYRSEGHIVKPEGTDKIQTVCVGCSSKWLSKLSLKDDLVMKNLKDQAWAEDYAKKQGDDGQK